MMLQNYGSEGICANLKVEVILCGKSSYILYIASHLKLSTLSLSMLPKSLAFIKKTFRNLLQIHSENLLERLSDAFSWFVFSYMYLSLWKRLLVIKLQNQNDELVRPMYLLLWCLEK